MSFESIDVKKHDDTSLQTLTVQDDVLPKIGADNCLIESQTHDIFDKNVQAANLLESDQVNKSGIVKYHCAETSVNTLDHNPN